MNYKVSKHIDLNQQASWCPGCGHGIICRIITDAADKLGVGDRIVTVDDVACGQFGQYAMLYIAPTGLVMATLQMLDMKMSHWFRFVWPMMVFTLVFGAILLSICSVVFAV